MEQDRVVLLIRALVFQVALYVPKEAGQHTAVQGQAELRHRPRPQKLMYLFHLQRPDQREKKEYARTGDASFLGTINEVP